MGLFRWKSDKRMRDNRRILTEIKKADRAAELRVREPVEVGLQNVIIEKLKSDLVTLQDRNERQAEVIASFGDRACQESVSGPSYERGEIPYLDRPEPVVDGGSVAPVNCHDEDDECEIPWLGYV